MSIEAPGSAVAGQIFNVGGDAENYRIADIGQMVAEIVGDVQVNTQNEVPDPRNYRVSFDKIRKSMGFLPAFSVADGIREIAAAVRADSSLQQYDQAVFHDVEAIRHLLSEAEQLRLLRV
jgi:nucleoside-diphosphate-sugar epimerase